MAPRYDCAIIGGGIVGLALAYTALCRHPSLRLLLLEKETSVASHQSGHNSGVIHSGIYYRPGSRKAANCRRGYQLLIDFCNQHEVAHEICGKLIVATQTHELPLLEELRKRGEANGLVGLKPLTAEQIREIEPHVAGLAGILVPQTGIIDFRAVAATLHSLIQQHDATVHLGEQVIGIRQQTDEVEIVTTRGSHAAAQVINCGGLQSDRLAQLTQAQLPWRIIPFRGEYYTVRPERRDMVRGLVYPVPNPAFPFLGVHYTRMLSGEVEAGPNAVLALKREGYHKFDFSGKDSLDTLLWPGFHKLACRYWRAGLEEMIRSFSKTAFVTALQRLTPDLRADDLEPGGAGVRAQACDRQGNLVDDFLFLADRRVFNVCNAPSPAATASLAIGEHICALALP